MFTGMQPIAFLVLMRHVALGANFGVVLENLYFLDVYKVGFG